MKDDKMGSSRTMMNLSRSWAPLALIFGALSPLSAISDSVPSNREYLIDSSGAPVPSGGGLSWRPDHLMQAVAIADRNADLVEKTEPKPTSVEPVHKPQPEAREEDKVKPKREPGPKPKDRTSPAITVKIELQGMPFGKAEMTDDQNRQLDNFAAALREATKERDVIRFRAIVVTGYADRIGSLKYNIDLSERRAAVVKDYLVSQGVDQKVIFWEGKAFKQPIPVTKFCDNTIARESLIECLSPNRRVTVELVGTRVFELSKKKPVVSSAAPKGNVSVPILYGTNRRKTGDNHPEKYFGDDEADRSQDNGLTLGRVVVSIPPSHVKGRLETPEWVWVRITLKKYYGVRIPFLELMKYGQPDPNKHFTFVYPIEELTDAVFQDELKASIALTESKSALVFVHGLGYSFAKAAYRTAQLTFDLKHEGYDVVPLMFTWPSDENYDIPGLGPYLAYIPAKDRAPSAGRHLAMYLKKVADITGVGVVHIVAHSMGATVLAEALGKLGKSNLVVKGPHDKVFPTFNQVILAAPDIRATDFEAAILPAVESGHRITNYASSNDEALIASKKVNSEARAGDLREESIRVRGVETIDASEVNNSDKGHSFFAESVEVIRDMQKLLSLGAKPEARGLQPVRRKNITYWRFPPN